MLDQHTPMPENQQEEWHKEPCLEWTGSLNKDGYGCIQRRIGGRNVRFSVHRVSWIVANGPIPEGLLVCHHCDNRKCYNLTHLFLGTPKDNAQDMSRKGRSVGPTRKLTHDQVLQIRLLLAHGKSHSSIAAMFGVSRPAISLIHEGRTYVKWR